MGPPLFRQFARDLDVETSGALELMYGNVRGGRRDDDSIVVLDMEFTHVALQARHRAMVSHIAKRPDLAQLPREVGYLRLGRVAAGSSRWRILGFERFHCKLPPPEQCALVPVRSASVAPATRQAMLHLEDAHLSVLKCCVRDDGVTVEAALADPQLLRECVPGLQRAVTTAVRHVHGSRHDCQRIMATLRRVVGAARDPDSPPHHVASRARYLHKVLEDGLYNVMHHTCRSEHARAIRSRCLELYESDPGVAATLDADHAHMRRLLDVLRRSLVLTKHLTCLDAIRNHVALHGHRGGLRQLPAGLTVVDVSTFNAISRVRFGDARLSTTAAGLARGQTRELGEALQELQLALQGPEAARGTPTPLDKCVMVLQVAVHMYSWFSAGIQLADTEGLEEVAAEEGATKHD